ncbi:MAG: DUF4097 domain-containing protein [Acidobacteriia bacterium]|nr:DUF4097 domain-containing protein [Terriglobia bacterium]
MKVTGRCALLMGVLAAVCQGQSERRFERTLSVTGPLNLELNTDAGGIVVRAGAAGTVRIRGILKGQWHLFWDGGTEERMRQLEAHPPIEQSGNTIRVAVRDKSLLRGISMRLEVEAPPETQLRARTDSGGIEVQGIHGPVDGQTDSGGIRASEIGGDVRASTDSGGIHVRRVNGEVRARADSGGIDALEVGGRVDAQTDSGGIRISQTKAAAIRARADSGGADIRLAPAGGYDIAAHTESGQVSAPNVTATGTVSRHGVDGKLRGGGPLVDVRVDSGSVTIR